MFLRSVTAAPLAGGGPASDLRTLPSCNAPSVASEPAARPERRRNARRSRPPPFCSDSAALSEVRRAWRSLLLISTGASSARVAVDAIERLHVIGFPVSCLALLIVGFGVGFRFPCAERRGRRDGRACSEHAKKFTTSNRGLVFGAHRDVLSLGPRRSSRQRKCLYLDVDEHAPERTDVTVEVGRRRALEIRKETPDPRRHVLLE